MAIDVSRWRPWITHDGLNRLLQSMAEANRASVPHFGYMSSALVSSLQLGPSELHRVRTNTVLYYVPIVGNAPLEFNDGAGDGYFFTLHAFHGVQDGRSSTAFQVRCYADSIVAPGFPSTIQVDIGVADSTADLTRDTDLGGNGWARMSMGKIGQTVQVPSRAASSRSGLESIRWYQDYIVSNYQATSWNLMTASKSTDRPVWVMIMTDAPAGLTRVYPSSQQSLATGSVFSDIPVPISAHVLSLFDEVNANSRPIETTLVLARDHSLRVVDRVNHQLTLGLTRDVPTRIIDRVNHHFTIWLSVSDDSSYQLPLPIEVTATPRIRLTAPAGSTPPGTPLLPGDLSPGGGFIPVITQ